MVNIQIKFCILQWGSWKSRQVEPGGFEEMERYSIIIVGKKFFWDVGSFFHIIWHDMIWRLKCGIIRLSLQVTRFWWWMRRFWLCRGRRRGGGKVHHQVLCSPIQKALGERSLQFVFFVPTNKSTAINPQLDINIYFQRKKILALATGAHPLIEKTIRPQSGGGRAAK